MTTSAFSSVMISLIPVVSMIAGVFTLKEVPGIKQYAFAALSVAGVFVMAFEGKSDGTVTVSGVVLMLGAVVSSVAYNVASRKISAEFSAFERTYAMTVIGLVAFLTIAIFENIDSPAEIIRPFFNVKYTGAIMYLGIFSSVVAFFLLNYANTHLPVAKTTVFSNVTMLVSVTAGIVFLDEPFSWETIVSAFMIIAGVCGVQLLNVSRENLSAVTECDTK